LLDLDQADDFKWLMRWLSKEKHCDSGIHAQLVRTEAMREKIRALDSGTRYLTPHQKMSRANDRWRARAKRRAEREQDASNSPLKQT
jgi:hypothetical protein